MNQEYTQAPIDPELGMSAPHLVDYWQVITRRLWLVLLIFGVTTAAAIWAVSRQSTYYETSLLVQVNDPLDRSRQITTPNILNTQIFVDPIESEIQVLRSGTVANSVVQRLGLRLLPPESTGLVRSQLFRDAYVAEETLDGGYELRYAPDGMSAELAGPSGATLGRAEAGSVLDAGQIRFTLMPAPSENRRFPLNVVPASSVAAEVQNPLVGFARENTNLIDVTFRHRDPVFAPAMLDAAAAALQDVGAEQVRADARRTLEFTKAELDSARVEFREASQELRDFQQTGAFTNLNSEEQRIVNQLRSLRDRLSNLERLETALQDLRGGLEGQGIEGVDLVSFLATLPQGAPAQLTRMVDEIQDRKDERQRLVTVEGLTESHFQVRGIREQIRSRESELQTAVEENLRVVQGDVAQTEGDLNTLLSQQANLPGLRNQLSELEIELDTHRQYLTFLNSQLYNAQILANSAEPYVAIVDGAAPPFAIRPRGRTNLILGAVLGIVLGIGAAFFLEYLDRTVRTSSDVETLLGIPVLGIIPRLRRLDIPEEELATLPAMPMLVATDPLDPAAEAYRNLRMNLMFMSTEDEPIKTILFSSPGPHEGKSTSALNFAVMLAQQGQRVLLIDADLRRPSLHKALDLVREPGLTNLLVSDTDAREAIRPNVMPNLDVLTSGPFPPNPSELLNSKSMQRLLEEFEGRYSHIIVDTPPLLAVTDAALVGGHTDGVVMVLRSGATEQRAAERAVDQLRRVGVRIFGAVLNEVSSQTTEESYYLQYYYSYHPREPKKSRLRESLSRARFW